MIAAPIQAQDADMKLSPNWEYVADTDMGGVSQGEARRETVAGREAIRLTGAVSLDNNGGIVQIEFDLAEGRDLRLRTRALNRPWQSFRACFVAPGEWTEVRIPFNRFEAHRTDAQFDPATLRRIGILAIGKVMEADISVSDIGFYR